MIATLHLFEPLEQKLIDLLKSLSVDDWNRPTVAKLWTVKDVAAHLLDTSVRTVALAQQHAGDPPEAINSYHDLLNYLNQLNADWVKAMRRVSTQTLIDFLQLTQKPMIDYYHSLDLQAPAMFPVAWAGEVESRNWFHIAREYTERWHHQQQIRDAVQQDGIMNREYFYPMVDTLLQALPYNYRTTTAPDGTCITVTITGKAGGTWIIQYQNNKWQLVDTAKQNVTTVTLTADTAWKLFTKALPAEEVNRRVKVSGQKKLSEPLLKMVAVMA
ncbi:MAG: maleylpyruvate isomerase N-terminal domain-containing protein [Cyclobacteriaceae bacterium]|nr:maleylpyruvate isomerase N-terminal domain-containing protein [Cyclobacteriaceae bacterium]